MSSISKKLVAEAEKLINIGQELAEYGRTNHGRTDDLQVQKFTLWANRCGEFISRVKDKHSEQSMTFDRFRAKQQMTSLHSNDYKRILEVNGAIESIIYEIENGLITSIRKLLQADIFSDFLEMGEHLLNEGYKDAAAVIIGSVLEDTLRKVSESNGIEVINARGKPLTIEPLNNELAKIEVYNKLVQKQITSWADLRNNAAHGHYDKYNASQVEMMLIFVQSFCADHIN